jgi:hypothetical protein
LAGLQAGVGANSFKDSQTKQKKQLDYTWKDFFFGGLTSRSWRELLQRFANKAKKQLDYTWKDFFFGGLTSRSWREFIQSFAGNNDSEDLESVGRCGLWRAF